MDTYTADWVKAARAKAGLTLEQLGDLVGRTKANVGHWEKGKHSPSYAQMIAISRVTGHPLPEAADLVMLDPSNIGNVIKGPEMRGEVPLISWVQAGSWQGAADPLQPGEGEAWLPCPVRHSARSYALRVRGDSMTTPHGNGRTYPEGCIIFVDPEKRMPNNGDRVIALLDGADEVTFKVYKNEDGRQWLQPLNPTHEPIRQPFKVLGTVLGKWEDG